MSWCWRTIILGNYRTGPLHLVSLLATIGAGVLRTVIRIILQYCVYAVVPVMNEWMDVLANIHKHERTYGYSVNIHKVFQERLAWAEDEPARVERVSQPGEQPE